MYKCLLYHHENCHYLGFYGWFLIHFLNLCMFVSVKYVLVKDSWLKWLNGIASILIYVGCVYLQSSGRSSLGNFLWRVQPAKYLHSQLNISLNTLQKRYIFKTCTCKPYSKSFLDFLTPGFRSVLFKAAVLHVARSENPFMHPQCRNHTKRF